MIANASHSKLRNGNRGNVTFKSTFLSSECSYGKNGRRSTLLTGPDHDPVLSRVREGRARALESPPSEGPPDIDRASRPIHPQLGPFHFGFASARSLRDGVRR